MTEEEDKIVLRSEEVQEILSSIPSWIVRWGITLVFAIVILMLVGTWYIKYPEIITAKVSVATENPPQRLVAQSGGKIKLLLKDKNTAKKGDYIAVVENPASTMDVLSLQKMLSANLVYVTDSIDSLHLNLETALQLGDLQTDYANLKQNYQNYRFYLQDNYYQNKIAAIQSQYEHYKTLNEKLSSQKELLAKDLALMEKKYNNDKNLFKQGVIAEIDLSRSEADYIQKRYASKNAEISLVNNEIQLDEYKKTIMDLQQQVIEKKRSYVVALQESFKKLQASIGAWEQRYVLKASIDGDVSYAKPYADGQYIASGEEAITIVPPANKIVAKAYVPLFGSGKIKPGERVNIKIDSYPFKEFGMLEGKVDAISLIPSNNSYLVSISLPRGMETNYHKQLEFKQEMSGTAEIITKDLRLIERLFNQILSLIKK